ncbi:MAG: hypothetical protein CM15mP120_08600 [Pseudomonadota bacterium]|nr:MAG: hypothetical protein CM15mP120_08600 [Pseudomonadota bacterium]
MHRRDAKVPIEEVAESLATLVKSGKPKQIGFSEIAQPVGNCPSGTPSLLCSRYSRAPRAPELGLIQKCAVGCNSGGIQPGRRSLLTDHPLAYEVCQQLMFLQVNPRFQADTYPQHGQNRWL